MLPPGCMRQAVSMLEAAVARIAEACLEAPLREAPWQHVADGLARELGGGKAVIVSLAPGWSPWGPCFVAGLDPAELASVAETHHRTNPWAGIGRRYPQGYFGLGFDALLTRAELRAGSFFNEWMLPTGLGSDVVYGGFPLKRDGVDELLVAVMSATGTRDPDPLHLAIGARAMPYLRHTFRLLEQLGRARPELADDTAWSARVLDRLGIAAFVVEAAGRLRHANRAADEVLRRGDVLCAKRGRITAIHGHETQRLLEQIARAASNVAACGGALVVGASEAEGGMHLTVSPLPGQGMSSGLALVLATPPAAASLSSVDVLRRSFGLTRAEARLIARLAAVLDLRQAADAEGIAYESARTYFKRAAGKLGVSSQTAAIERVRQIALIRGE